MVVVQLPRSGLVRVPTAEIAVTSLNPLFCSTFSRSQRFIINGIFVLTMFSHISVGTSNLSRATQFYTAVLSSLELVPRPVTPDGGPLSSCWISKSSVVPRFYVYEPFNGKAASVGNGVMVAFLAPVATAVDQAYKTALEFGGIGEGEPSERAHYGVGYYGAYFRDLDGNKIHIAYRGDLL